MRSNLISLQNISKLQDQTQLRLSTGLKVNSAIDNPSSYYAAQSLSNRAGDLRSLLDAMGQGIQTIKAANEGIETAGELLNLAEVEVQNAMEQIGIPSKEYFERRVGANGAVVSSTEELVNAVNSGKEEICIYGSISLTDTSISLKNNQKLVGTEYYTGYSGKEKFSKLEINISEGYSGNDIIQLSGNSILSDIAIRSDIHMSKNLITVTGTNTNANIRNVDTTTTYNQTGQISSILISSGHVTLSGHINIQSLADENSASQTGVQGIYNRHGNCDIVSDTTLNIKATSVPLINYGYTRIHDGAKLKLYSETSIALSNGYIDGDYNKYQQDLIIENNVELYLQSDEYYALRNLIADNITFSFGENVKFSYKDNKSQGVKVTSKAGVLQNSDTLFTGADLPTEYFAQTSQEYQSANIAEILKFEAQDASNYNQLLSQYDMLIKDSSYKGINLLETDRLKINFNEDKSAKVMVEGVDVTSKSLGLQTTEWLTQDDVQKSLEQITNAKNVLRSAASQLGNYYSIITTREDFTNKLINVLEEGADKLTLADMNEESANMLALQTRQSLAINSLSLASQANQAILKLF